jgi:magnesium transporter
MKPSVPHLNEPIAQYARRDFALLRSTMTVREALDAIREQGVGEKVVYFYVVDENDRLAGVLPTRRLLMAKLDQRVAEVMVPSVIAIPEEASVLEACEYFLLHRFLAFPVVDERRRVTGIVDVGQFTEEVFDLAEREQADTVFESLGLRVAQVRDASPVKAFRYRFPWLLATIASGTACALLAGAFEATLAESLVLAFFLALVLGLGESVSMQSMTVTIQALRGARPTVGWYARSLRREVTTAVLLGGACGLIVALIAWVWRGDGPAAWVLGTSIMLSLLAACVLGLTVPWLLHACKLDPKIAAGPVTLALTDVGTLLFYFGVATLVL